MEFFRPTWEKILIVVILVLLGVGITVTYLLEIGKKQHFSLPLVISTPTPILTPTEVVPSISTNMPPPTFPPIDMSVSHWKTYQNDKIGISFKYPNSWKVNTFAQDTPAHNGKVGDVQHSVVDLGPTNEPANTYSMSLVYWDNPDNLPVREFIQEAIKATNYAGATGIDLDNPPAQTISIGGFPAYSQRHAECEPEFCDKAVIPYKNMVFVFSLLEESQKAFYRDVFDQILSTFKFITP